MIRSNLPNTILLPRGEILKPVIGGFLDQKPFLNNGWAGSSEQEITALIIAQAKSLGLKYRKVIVRNNNLQGKLDLHGQPYRDSVWVFVQVVKPYQWVMAPLCGVWMCAWFSGMENGKFQVEFTNDGPRRLVDKIKPLKVPKS